MEIFRDHFRSCLPQYLGFGWNEQNSACMKAHHQYLSDSASSLKSIRGAMKVENDSLRLIWQKRPREIQTSFYSMNITLWQQVYQTSAFMLMTNLIPKQEGSSLVEDGMFNIFLLKHSEKGSNIFYNLTSELILLPRYHWTLYLNPNFLKEFDELVIRVNPSAITFDDSSEPPKKNSSKKYLIARFYEETSVQLFIDRKNLFPMFRETVISLERKIPSMLNLTFYNVNKFFPIRLTIKREMLQSKSNGEVCVEAFRPFSYQYIDTLREEIFYHSVSSGNETSFLLRFHSVLAENDREILSLLLFLDGHCDKEKLDLHISLDLFSSVAMLIHTYSSVIIGVTFAFLLHIFSKQITSVTAAARHKEFLYGTSILWEELRANRILFTVFLIYAPVDYLFDLTPMTNHHIILLGFPCIALATFTCIAVDFIYVFNAILWGFCCAKLEQYSNFPYCKRILKWRGVFLLAILVVSIPSVLFIPALFFVLLSFFALIFIVQRDNRIDSYASHHALLVLYLWCALLLIGSFVAALDEFQSYSIRALRPLWDDEQVWFAFTSILYVISQNVQVLLEEAQLNPASSKRNQSGLQSKMKRLQRFFLNFLPICVLLFCLSHTYRIFIFMSILNLILLLSNSRLQIIHFKIT